MTTSRTPISVEDLYELGWLEDVRVSPDGSRIAYVHVTVDRPANKYRRAIYLVPAAAARPGASPRAVSRIGSPAGAPTASSSPLSPPATTSEARST